MSTTTTPATTRKRRTPRKLRPLKRSVKSIIGRTNVIKEADTVVPAAAFDTGTLNEVARTRLRITLGSSTDAFFKKRRVADGNDYYSDETRSPSEFAVASSRLARALGLGNRIARNKWAKLGGEIGVISGKVPGRPLYRLVLDPKDPKQILGRVYQPVDLSDPRIQKGLSDLQLFDAITGQRDRHGGNIYIDAATGQVSGIDDDLSFLAGELSKNVGDPGTDSKYRGLPLLIDAATARRVLALNANGLESILTRTGDPVRASPAALDYVGRRLRVVQQFIREHPSNLVSTWDRNTFEAQIDEPDLVSAFKGGSREPRSYLKREQAELDKAASGASTEGSPSWLEGDPPPRRLVAAIAGDEMALPPPNLAPPPEVVS